MSNGEELLTSLGGSRKCTIQTHAIQLLASTTSHPLDCRIWIVMYRADGVDLFDRIWLCSSLQTEEMTALTNSSYLLQAGDIKGGGHRFWAY
mgnify:CR=1 FL=1